VHTASRRLWVTHDSPGRCSLNVSHIPSDDSSKIWCYIITERPQSVWSPVATRRNARVCTQPVEGSVTMTHLQVQPSRIPFFDDQAFGASSLLRASQQSVCSHCCAATRVCTLPSGRLCHTNDSPAGVQPSYHIIWMTQARFVLHC
jgi:hypothetical protein